MKKLVTAVLLALFVSGPAWATCTTNTLLLPDGRMMFCTTCCSGGNCTTTCV